MATTPKGIDRRVLRTRRSIMQASREIMREKGFDAMTVQDIADRANVNRGTFYAHFADKYELIDRMIREEFQQYLDERISPDARWDEETLRRLITTVMDFFARCYPPDAIGTMIYQATYEELMKRLTAWLGKAEAAGQSRWVAPEPVAQVVTWTILGAAVHHSRSRAATSAKLANDVWLVLSQGLHGIVSMLRRSPTDRADAAEAPLTGP